MAGTLAVIKDCSNKDSARRSKSRSLSIYNVQHYAFSPTEFSYTGLDDRVTGEELNLARILTEKFILNIKAFWIQYLRLPSEPEVDIPEGNQKYLVNLMKNSQAITREVSILSSVTSVVKKAPFGWTKPCGERPANDEAKNFFCDNRDRNRFTRTSVVSLVGRNVTGSYSMISVVKCENRGG